MATRASERSHITPTAEQQTALRRNGTAPTVLDVTAGGGSIPFEAGQAGTEDHSQRT